MADALLAVGCARDDRLDFLLSEEGAKRIRVIIFAGQKFLDAGDQADPFLRAFRHEQHGAKLLLSPADNLAILRRISSVRSHR